MSRSHINDATSALDNAHSSNNTHSLNCTHILWNPDVTGERSQILAWLSPLEPRIRHQDIRRRRADSVGEWLLETDEFKKWCDGAQEGGSEHATLFCCGGPAVGKTYFSSLVVDRLCDKADEETIAVACFYVDFAERGEQSPTNILGSLLRQIVGGLERIPDEINRTFQNYKKVTGGTRLRVPEIVRMLQIVTSLQPTIICLDGLDECAEGDRPEVLDSLRQILGKSPNTRIFLTGRRHVRGEVQQHLGGAVVLSIKPEIKDIVGYIRMRLSKDTSRDAMDSGLEAEIFKSIAGKIPETFLLVSLTIDAILAETTAYGRRQKLRAMINGLGLKGVYGAILQGIKAQGGERTRLGMAALMWIAHSERPLQPDELLHALAIEIGSGELNLEKIPSVETLSSACLGLVVVETGASTVRLVHFTLQEYLHTCLNLFGATHSVMAETCLTYLNFRTVTEISPTLVALPSSTSFLRYSSLHWGSHARRGASKDVVSLALKLFGQIESHISTKLLLLDIVSRTGRYYRDIPINGHLIGFTGLHFASVFGIVEIATALMDLPNTDPNGRDFLSITPLIWAAICGQERLAMLLLERRTVISDKSDKFFRRTALLWAAGKGNVGIVRLLLARASAKPDGTDGWRGKVPRVMNMVRGRRYVNPNRLDKYGQTPILFASEKGHEEVVQVLLRRKDVKPDTVDEHGRTLLFWASSKGYEEVVKMLLERGDVKIDRLDQYGQTPLQLAAEEGHEGVVELLLGREEINPNTPSKTGKTPLALASERGRGGVVKLLLGREGIGPDWPDFDGRTPLSWAAENGCGGVVKILLGREDVNPDAPDKGGRTPLSFASRNGCDGVVKLLLEREDINPDRPDIGGRTPLSRAAGNGRDGVVKLLLGRGGINSNTPDNGGLTPLSWAAENGCDGVVKLLLERAGVSPDRPDNGGRTSLSRAAGNGRDGVVKLLLGREDVNPDRPDNSGRTPLSWAAGTGRDGLVKLLLGWGGINPDIPDNGGLTPLSFASGNGCDGVVKLLLEREGVNPDRPDIGGRTPLSRAAGSGHDGVVKLLLGRRGINPDIPDKGGLTPLSWAAEEGCDSVVKLLLEREDANPDRPDNGGRTLFSWAAGMGNDGLVKLLLGRGGINTDTPDTGGRTPLSWAAGNGRDGVVKRLLELENVNPDRPDIGGRTPLSWAAGNGRGGVVKLLLARDDINPDRPDKGGKTPLLWAANHRHPEALQLLQTRASVNPSTN